MGPYFPTRYRIVEKEWFAAYISTNVPFAKVEWFVNGVHEYTDTPAYEGQTYSFFNHLYRFLGTKTGNDVAILARAYTTILRDRDAEEMTIQVFDDNGFVRTKVVAEVLSIDLYGDGGDHEYILKTRHTVYYYNDGRPGASIAVRARNVWYEYQGDDSPENEDDFKAHSDTKLVSDEILFPTYTAYQGYGRIYLKNSLILKSGRFYAAEAYTGEGVSVLSPSYVRYQGMGIGIPPYPKVKVDILNEDLDLD